VSAHGENVVKGRGVEEGQVGEVKVGGIVNYY
jgi:hypothetical protein